MAASSLHNDCPDKRTQHQIPSKILPESHERDWQTLNENVRSVRKRKVKYMSLWTNWSSVSACTWAPLHPPPAKNAHAKQIRTGSEAHRGSPDSHHVPKNTHHVGHPRVPHGHPKVVVHTTLQWCPRGRGVTQLRYSCFYQGSTVKLETSVVCSENRSGGRSRVNATAGGHFLVREGHFYPT